MRCEQLRGIQTNQTAATPEKPKDTFLKSFDGEKLCLAFPKKVETHYEMNSLPLVTPLSGIIFLSPQAEIELDWNVKLRTIKTFSSSLLISQIHH